MYTTRLASAFALALVLAACSDSATTAPTSSTATLTPSSASAARVQRPVPSTAVTNAPLKNADGDIIGSFTGTVTLRHVDVVAGQIIGTLAFAGTSVVNGVTNPNFNDTGKMVMYTSASAASTAAVAAAPLALGSCPVLDLDIGAIHLDLLGLVVDLSAIHLDIVAQSGPGNLLGNLLCAIVGLLDGSTGGLLGNALANLLDTINGILSGL
jgi:hypothetical protein